MSKKKKRSSGHGGSVLDEPVLRSKEPDADAVHADEVGEAAAEAVDDAIQSFADAVLSEDDSVSDVPAEVVRSAGAGTGIEAEDADAGTVDEDDTADDTGTEDGGIIDDDGFEDDFPDDDGYDHPADERLPLAERIIAYASAALSVFMLGASLVFWVVMLRYLLRCPYVLADTVQIKWLLAGCALFPAAVALVQHRLRRPVSPERWLINLCLSGALTTLLVVIVQALIRHTGYSVYDLMLTLCSSVAGCALPAALFLGLRALIERLRLHLRRENSKPWDIVRRDVLSLTDIGRS